MTSPSTPLVTIVIPVFNGARFLMETLAAVASQTYEAIELILIDDASTDDSREVLEDFELRKKIKVRTIWNRENEGLTKSANKASKLASGELLLFLGQDDLLPAGHVEIMVKCWRNTDTVLWCNSLTIDADGAVTGKSLNSRLQTLKNFSPKVFLMGQNYISSTGAVIRSSSFREVGGFDEQFKNYGEWSLWIALTGVGDIRFCSAPFVYYRRTSNTLSSAEAYRINRVEKSCYDQYCREFARVHLALTFPEKVLLRVYGAYVVVRRALRR